MNTIKHYLILSVVCIFSNGVAQTFTNPIADLPDPFITYIDGYYYYTGTTGVDVSLKRSKTLEGLKQTPSVRLFGPGDPGAQLEHYWAPEIFKFDGKWYIYYSALQQGSTMRTFVIENTSNDPMNPANWTFKGKLYSPGQDYWAIDGTVLELAGTRYFLWSGIDIISHSFNYDKPQRNYISKMSNPWTLTGSRTLLTSPSASELLNKNFVNEGPEVLHKNGKVFMVYSSNGCNTPYYHLKMISIDDTKDPLVASNWISHGTVFSKDASVSSYGTGHHSFFKSPDGTEDWIAYHATPNPGGNCTFKRTPRAKKIAFAANGTPEFGTPIAAGQPIKAPSGEPNLAIDKITNGLYEINQINTSKLVEVKNASNINPSNIVQGNDRDGLHQQWWIQATGNGYYTAVSALSGLSLGVGSCKLSTASVNLRKPNGSKCQLWAIEDLGSGIYKFTNKNSGLAMEVEASGIDIDGSNIQQNTWLNADHQKFNLKLIKKTLNASEQKLINTVVLYPNPFRDKIHINSTAKLKDKQYKIYNNLGQQVASGVVDDDPILVEKLVNGIYYMLLDGNSYQLIKQ